MKSSDYIARFLEAQGVKTVFEMAGGMITHMLDSLHQLTPIDIVSMHHEQSASFAADAYGRVTGVPGVAMATSGPGATNLLTGIASCYFDSSPAVFITGQVNIHEQKGDRNIRQLGFQETDIISMARPVTKACYAVTDAHELPAILEDAFRIALSGRPGPVLIDIPMNLQRVDITPTLPIPFVTRERVAHQLTPGVFDELVAEVAAARKPLILVGRGVRSSFMTEEFRRFVELTQIPVVTTLLAVDAIPHDHPLRVGYIGSYGNRWANMALGHADLLIVLGSRLDIRQTGADTDYFKGTRPIYHVDCEVGEINNRVLGCREVVADLEDFFTLAHSYYTPELFQPKQEWLEELAASKVQWRDTNELPDITGINPNVFMHALSKPRLGSGYVADVGNHQMWAAQSLELGADQLYMTSGGLGSMGFALPAALGMCFATGRKPVVVIAGDGGFQMNIQELQCIVHNKLPVKLVVLNNNCLGMIRQFQDSYFEGRYQSTYWGYSAPDFTKIAEAYGIKTLTIASPDDVEQGADWLWADPNEPALLQVMIDTHTNCYPKLAFGRPITEMEPFAKPLEMEGT
ncbi:thiamine pyrophosphate-binding protein [Hymenobacter sp. BT175]|uniref:thiamine pyrophosphate-binding protein n=1 Tax=Hymenobacter translucens TaxID=2886507 RepID=UPI001D0DC36A|nr:thiamine pyrophosphate-binding protein [Hymenobacter translucens]MCC2547921.1 thiamine pyrophosphate-binding protein [Hymenobacter translucens]